MYMQKQLSKEILTNFNWSSFDAYNKKHPMSNGLPHYSRSFKDTVLYMCNVIIFGHSRNHVRNSHGFALVKHSPTQFTFVYTDSETGYSQSVLIKEGEKTIVNINNPKASAPDFKSSVTMKFGPKQKTASDDILDGKKYIYRFRLKGEKKYCSPGYKSKSTWQRVSAVIDAVKEEAKRHRKNISDYEICLFPIEEPQTVSAETLIKMYSDKQKNAALSKAEREKKTKKKELENKKKALMDAAAKIQDEINKLQ